MSKELGRRIKLARKKAGIKQDNLADLLSIHFTSLSNYETGKRPIDAPVLSRIAKLTNCDPAWLLTGEEPGTSISDTLDVPPEHRGYTDKLVKILTSGNTSAITTVEKIIDMTLREIDPPEKEGLGQRQEHFPPTTKR